MKHEILSIAKKLAMLGGFLVVLAGVFRPALLLVALVLGAGAILLSGRLKRSTWSGVALLVGGVSYVELETSIGTIGAVLVVASGLMGLSTSLI